jgi:hypothetical protein
MGNSIDGSGPRIDSTIHFQKATTTPSGTANNMCGDGDEDLPAQRLFNRFDFA